MNPEILAAYARLAIDAMARTPREALYIGDLHTVWATRLAELPDIDIDGPTPRRLLSAIGDPRLSDDARLDWLDAFPEAIEATALR